METTQTTLVFDAAPALEREPRALCPRSGPARPAESREERWVREARVAVRRAAHRAPRGAA